MSEIRKLIRSRAPQHTEIKGIEQRAMICKRPVHAIDAGEAVGWKLLTMAPRSGQRKKPSMRTTSGSTQRAETRSVQARRAGAPVPRTNGRASGGMADAIGPLSFAPRCGAASLDGCYILLEALVPRGPEGEHGVVVDDRELAHLGGGRQELGGLGR